MTCSCNNVNQGVTGLATTFGAGYSPSRPVTVKVPNAFRQDRLYPLILTLHGYGQTGLSGAQTLIADNAQNWGGGCIVASPEGTLDSSSNQFWNATDALLDKFSLHPNDQVYLRQLIIDIKAVWPIDPKFIVVMGYSNGGAMAHMLGRSSSDLVTHIVSCSGVGPLAGDPRIVVPPNKVNVVHFHGTSDVTVTYAGNPPGPAGAGLANYPGAVQTVTDWATLNGNTGSLTQYDTIDASTGVVGSETSRQQYTTDPVNGKVEHWKATGLDHTLALNPSVWPQAVYAWIRSHPRN